MRWRKRQACWSFPRFDQRQYAMRARRSLGGKASGQSRGLKRRVPPAVCSENFARRPPRLLLGGKASLPKSWFEKARAACGLVKISRAPAALSRGPLFSSRTGLAKITAANRRRPTAGQPPHDCKNKRPASTSPSHHSSQVKQASKKEGAGEERGAIQRRRKERSNAPRLKV